MSKESKAEAVEQPVADIISIEATSLTLSEAGIEKIAADFKIGSTLDKMVELFGEEVVKSNAQRNIVIFVQGNLRRWSKAMVDKDGTVDAAKLQELTDALKPGVVSRSKMSLVDKAKKLAEGMNPDELKEYEAFLREQAASA